MSKLPVNRKYAYVVAKYWDGATIFEGFHAVFLNPDSASREAGELNKDCLSELGYAQDAFEKGDFDEGDEDEIYHVFPVCLVED